MKNNTILDITNKLGDVFSKIDGDFTMKDLIDSGILNKRSTGQITDKSYGPFKMIVGQFKKLEHIADYDMSRFIQIIIKNPITDEYEVDDLNNYTISMNEDIPTETYITKVHDNRSVNLHSKEVETIITVSFRKGLESYNQAPKDILIYDGIYIISNLKDLITHTPEFNIEFAFCIETRSLYQRVNNTWKRCKEADGIFNSKYNNYDKLSHIEFKTTFELAAGDHNGISFPSTDLYESIFPTVIQYDTVSKKIINEYEIDKQLTSVLVRNKSVNKCFFSLSLKISYENNFVLNVYENLVEYFVKYKLKPNETKFIYTDMYGSNNIDFSYSSIGI